MQESVEDEDEINTSKEADEVPKVFTKKFTKEPAIAVVDSTNPIDKGKIPKE